MIDLEDEVGSPLRIQVVPALIQIARTLLGGELPQR